MRYPIKAAYPRRPQRDKVRDSFHDSSGVFRHGSVADFCGSRITLVFNICGRNNKDRRSADFVEAVNMRPIVGGVLTDAVLCFTNKVGAVAEFSGPSRTDFGAGCRLAGSQAVGAHDAFADSRIQRLPFILGLAERASHHAVAAANALPDVVHDWAFGGLMESTHGADRRARGLLAMHAEAAHEFVVFGENDRVFVCRLHRLRGYRVVVGQFVLLRAGTLALLAADAHGGVIQNGLTHEVISRPLRNRTSARRA